MKLRSEHSSRPDHAMGYSQCARLGDHDADLGHVLDGPLEALAPEARIP